jgi:hypothetical protein
MTEAAGSGAAAGAAAGAGAGAAAGGAAGAAAGNAGAAAAAGAAAPWYGDKIDETTRGFWTNKGIDPNDPVSVATKLTEFYRGAESRLGAPPEELIRIPKPNAPEADIRAYWGRIGVPAEPKDYDLSAVKRSDGKDLDPGLADTFRAAAITAKVPKDQAAGLLTAIVKHNEAQESARLAEKTAVVKAEREALDQNWGTNKTYNLGVAERALQDLGKASGLTPEQTKQAWDALSTVGGVGASYAMEMLRNIGARMGEGTFITPPAGPGGNNAVMSQAQARAKIEELKADTSFYNRLVKQKEVAAKREWEDLHKIAFGRAA